MKKTIEPSPSREDDGMKKLTANDPQTHSADVVAENVGHLKALFPEAFSEGKVDFEVLKQMLGGTVLLLKIGLDLCVPIETRTLAGRPVNSIGTGALLTCLAERITQADVEPLASGIVAWHQELAPTGDATVIFRDSAFADDVAKTNLAAILEQHGLGNVRSL